MRHVSVRRATALGAAACVMWVTQANRSEAQRSVADGRSAAHAIADAVLARPVTIRLDGVALDLALNAIAENAGVHVQYRTAAIAEARQTVTLHATRLPLGTALERVLAGTNLHVSVVANDRIDIGTARGNADRLVGGVAGRVTDGKRGVEGATLTLEGTKLSTRTDAHGAFHLGDVPAGTYTLVVRRLGFTVARKAVTVADTQTAPVDVTLAASSTALQEVVTTVTGPQRRLELGTVVSRINADSLVREGPITSVSQLLTGRVPGLIVSQGQGTVGGNIKLQIRGQTSLSLSTEPIVILDGIRYTSRAAATAGVGEQVSPLNDLNPNDIATIEVVKGASAATLYGTDAANGVIVITTKRGVAGPARWSAFASGESNGVPSSHHYPDSYFAWSPQFGAAYPCVLEWLAFHACTQDSIAVRPNPLNNSATSILHPARSWMYGASTSGGEGSLRYFFSGNFNDMTGPVEFPPSLVQDVLAQRGISKLPEEMRRPNAQTVLNLRSNVTASLNPKLDLTVGGGYVHGDTRSISAIFAPFTSSYENTPNRNEGILAALNQFARTSTEGNDRFITSANAQARPASWLTTRATVGVDVSTRNREELLPRDSTRELDPQGAVKQSRTRQFGTSADIGSTMTLRRGWLTSRTSIGGQYNRDVQDVLLSTGGDLPPGSTSIGRAGWSYSSQEFDERVTLGSYLEQSFGMNERLFLTGAMRIDGASAFGSGYSAAIYPKISASWLLSDEPFMPNLPGIDEIRFRTAVGASGQQALPTWALPRYDISSPPAQSGYGRPIGVMELGNPLLRPERVREWEQGLDAGLLNRRLQFDLTWYRRRTADQIIYQSMGPGLGWGRLNLGLTTERGFEAQVTATLLDTRLAHLQATFQRSTRTTKLIRLGNNGPYYSPYGGYVAGYPIGVRFINPLASYNDVNGDGILIGDEVTVGATPVYAGRTDVPMTQTLTTTLGLFQQRLRISALLDRQMGLNRINDFAANCYVCRANVDPTTPLIDQAIILARRQWQVPGPGYRYVESGNFTRLREMTFALTIPSALLRSAHLQSGSISLSARNLGLWSNFSGPDPESVPVIDAGTYQSDPSGIPQARTWALRFDLGL